MRAMLRYLLFAYQFNLDRGRVMVKDLSDEQMVWQPHGVVNHPAWILGHLALSSDGLARRYGLESTLPDGWAGTFGAGGIPSGADDDFPGRDRILDELAAQHARVAEVVAAADPAVFEAPFPDERRRQTFPTLGDYTAFVMTTHEGSHIGQIAAWRRAMGLGSATGI